MNIALGTDHETRMFAGAIRAARAANGNHLAGYAAVFDSLSVPMWGFREKIAPGAFSEVLGDDVRCLLNHDPSLILGRTRSGTLNLAQDDHGLSIDDLLPDTQLGRDTAELVGRGDISQMSFAFSVAEESWEYHDDGSDDIRTILKFKRLYDVSPVTYPAYPETSIGLRDLEIAQQRVRERIARKLPVTGDEVRLLERPSPTYLVEQEKIRVALALARRR